VPTTLPDDFLLTVVMPVYNEERTLEEIGSLLGVTRERIRQIRNRAFEKLRESPHGDSLSGFWGDD